MANVIDKVYLKVDEENNRVEMYFKVFSDFVMVKDENGNQQSLTDIAKAINNALGEQSTKISNIETSLGTFANGESAATEINNLKNSIQIIQENDFSNKIKPANFQYDSAIEALRLTFSES